MAQLSVRLPERWSEPSKVEPLVHEWMRVQVNAIAKTQSLLASRFWYEHRNFPLAQRWLLHDFMPSLRKVDLMALDAIIPS